MSDSLSADIQRFLHVKSGHPFPIKGVSHIAKLSEHDEHVHHFKTIVVTPEKQFKHLSTKSLLVNATISSTT